MFNAADKGDTLSQSLDVLRNAGINRYSLTAHDDTVENGNFLSSFYTVVMSLIIIHYDKVSDNNKPYQFMNPKAQYNLRGYHQSLSCEWARDEMDFFLWETYLDQAV